MFRSIALAWLAIVPATITAAAQPSALPAPEPAASAAGVAAAPQRVDDFRLNDHLGRSHRLYALADAPAVVLYIHGCGCPIVRQSVPALNRLAEEFGKQGVAFLMLNANTQDTRADLAQEAEDFGIAMPILHDPVQRIALGLGAARTAECIVIDPQDQWRIVYRGPVDDRFDYGAQKDGAKHAYLRDALEAHLGGRPVETARVETKGCRIAYDQPQDVQYARDVAPILAAKCVPCHTEGGLGPFAYSNRRKARGWADMMRETLRTRRMPPWHADPESKLVQHALGLSVADERTLLAWAETGAPDDGQGPDPLRDAPQQPHRDWALGTPDLVLSMPKTEELPAEGIIDYRYIYIPSGLTEDKWVRAAEVKPGNAKVVHHALIFIVYPEQYAHLQPEFHSGLEGYFEAFLPGDEIKPYPADAGQFVPAGSTFVFQMHYNATGKPETDRTQMGLYFHDQPPAKALKIGAGFYNDFYIPANAPDTPVAAEFRFDGDAEILGLSPHMHYRGSRARFDVIEQGGARSTLLNIPFYEFDWQPMYAFGQPIPVPAGTRLAIDGGWDNSKFNPKNPDPTENVEFGEQSWEEMFIGYVKYAEPRDPARYVPVPITRAVGPALDAESLKATTWQIGRRFSVTLDADGKALLNGRPAGKWWVEGTSLRLKGLTEDLTLLIRGDQLLFGGRVVRRADQPPNA